MQHIQNYYKFLQYLVQYQQLSIQEPFLKIFVFLILYHFQHLQIIMDYIHHHVTVTLNELCFHVKCYNQIKSYHILSNGKQNIISINQVLYLLHRKFFLLKYQLNHKVNNQMLKVYHLNF